MPASYRDGSSLMQILENCDGNNDTITKYSSIAILTKP